jgi:amino acid adenylation domain-containing protein
MEKFIPETKLQPVDFDPFAGPAIVRTAPSTEAQREVWVASQMSREASCSYNESVSLALTGQLDSALMERAIHALVERHEGMRSVISADGLRVIVQESMEVPFTVKDLSGLGEAERERQLVAIADHDMTTPFDLQHGPLFRVWLLRTGAEEHLLRISGHHVMVDGWSLGILMADVSRLYNALLQGREPGLPQAHRFSDYAIAQIDFAKSTEHERVEQYWLDLFKGGAPRVDLPTDRPRPSVKTYNGKRLDLDMDPALVRRLRETATRSGASFVTTLLTSFELLVFKLTGSSDVVVGLPAAGQSDYGMKDLVGQCVNLLALRSRIDEEASFLEHLKLRRTAVLDAFDNQKYTFGTLVRKLNVPREPGRIPLCPVVFNIDMNMDDGVAFSGLHHRFISNPRRYEQFELFLNATGKEDHLTLEWSYNTDLFDEATVRGWMEQFTSLVDRITAHPEATLADLAGDGALEGSGAMPRPEWQGGFNDYPKVDIATLFDAMVERYPDHIALERIDERLTYRALQQRARVLSNKLVDMGVKPGEPVGICMDRVIDMVTAKLAILRAGGCYVPFDPTYPVERLQFMFADSDVKVLFSQRHMLDQLPPHNAQVLFPDEITEAADRPMPTVSLDAPAYIMYTSGSTGTPKGVVVPHRGIVRLVRDQFFVPFGPDLTWLQLSNVSFDLSTLEIWGALLNGGRCVLQPQLKPSLLEIVETIHRHKVTSVWFTTGLFNLLVDEHVERLRGLKHIIAGGDVLSVAHVKKALRVLGPGVLINGYGPTENTTFTTCWPINDEAAIGVSVPIGRPLDNTTVHILDEKLEPVPVGRKGELWTGGDGVALGYWKRPELTAERFIDDPFRKVPGAKLYKTGDLARWLPDGTIQFIGRADGQVKIRGFRVELGEIENAVNDVAEVKDKVVVVRQTPSGDKLLTCYVVPKAEATVGDAAREEALIDAVRDHLRAKLPAYMMPTAFVVIDHIPLTGNGKVDRRALPEPKVRTSVMKAEHVGPRDAEEAVLAEIWGRMLGAKDLGVHDNFFDLGGHSITGIQVLAEVERRFGRKLGLNSLYQSPTIAQFALLVRSAVDRAEVGAVVEMDTLAVIRAEGSKVPFVIVHGDDANMSLPKLMGNDQPYYAMLHQGDDGMGLKHRSVEAMAEHHLEQLRKVRPHGPYILCGVSFGGLIAYELAQRLTRAGEQVPLLILADTYSTTIFKDAMRTERKLYEPLKDAVLRRMADWYLARGKRLPPKLLNFDILDTYNRASYVYTAQPYAGNVLLLKAIGSGGGAYLGWRELVKGELWRVETPGDHSTMIKEPHVRTLARHIQEGIERAMRQVAVEAV